MTSRLQRAASVPPLLVGASAAIAAEVAIGILLYAGPGLMRSLTTILAVESVAFAAGLWHGPMLSGNEVDRLRLRWLLCLGSFAGAAMFGTSWSVIESMGGGAVGQGLGLAILAALPLYTCGLILAGMAKVTGGTDRPGSGASAALGAALGFVVTGVLLPRAPIPSSLLVACLVMLSAAGLLFGVVIAGRAVVHVRAVRASGTGNVRVEDRIVGDEPSVRSLLEAGIERARIGLADAAPERSWDVAVTELALTERGGWSPATRILSVGGGASPLARELCERYPGVHLDVLERGEWVVELARDHLGIGPAAVASECVKIEIGNLEDLLAASREPYDLVLVDTRALVPLGGIDGLSLAARSALFDAVGEGGVLAVGPEPERAAALGVGRAAMTVERAGTSVLFRRGPS
jgi:hypothetical protein